MEKCQCYIHSLKQGEQNRLGEATILKKHLNQHFNFQEDINYAYHEQNQEAD